MWPTLNRISEMGLSICLCGNSCTFQVGCQENREKPEITEPINPIQYMPHDFAVSTSHL